VTKGSDRAFDRQVDKVEVRRARSQLAINTTTLNKCADDNMM